MSSPANTPPSAAPEETGFDPLVFWIQHRSKIVLLVLLLLVALVTYSVSEWMRMRKLDGARDLFTHAKTVEDYRKVIAEYPGTGAAGDAYLLLAAKLRDDGKLADSTTALQTFAAQYPQHELVSGAWTSIAANQEAEGKPDDALATYQKVSTSYPNSFSAPLALLAEGRLLQAKGKKDEARKIYEQLTTRYPDNALSQMASIEMSQLDK